MAQIQDGTSRASTRRSRAKKKNVGEAISAEQTFITSAERKKRKGELTEPDKVPKLTFYSACQGIGLLGAALSYK